ncbi:MAG: sigma-70 family RNA polymerase sigma factor [Planctomycetota bacterium]
MSLPAAPDGTQSLELLRRLRAGDSSAFDRLYRRHRDELLLAVRAGMGPKLRAAMQSEDVLQSVAMEAFAALQRRPEPPAAGFTGMLRGLVRHRLIDRARALARGRGGEVELSESVAEDASASATAMLRYTDPRFEQLEKALLALPEDMREVVQLRRFEGLSSQEVAARTGRSDDAARKLFSRAMAKLTLLVGGAQ